MTRVATGRIFAVLVSSAVLSSSCGDATSAQPDQPNESQPLAAAPATAASGFVAGPNGESLFGFDGPSPNSTLTFRQVARSTTEGKVLNSDKSFDLMLLPATFRADLVNEICTATLIGPRVILTAAHCIDERVRDDGGKWRTARVTVARASGQGEMNVVSCAMAPTYVASEPAGRRPRNENDFALCELVSEYRGVRAETIATDPMAAATGQKLMLAGFGCRNSELTDGQMTLATRPSGILNVGFNTVQTANTDGWMKLEGRIGTDAAILCAGDSGGAAFSGVDLNAANDHGWRIVAINSAVGLGPVPANPSYISYLSPLADPDFLSFMNSWMQERRTRRKICGVNLSFPVGNCRL